MKKILSLALVMVLALSLLAACGDKDDGNSGKGGNNNGTSQNGGNNNGGNNNGNTEGKLTISATMADGWRVVTGLSANADSDTRYQPVEAALFTHFSVVVQEEIWGDNSLEAAEREVRNQKLINSSYEFSDIREVTVDGRKGYEFTMSDPSDERGTHSTLTFICIGDYKYLIQQVTTISQVEIWSADLAAMYASVKLK